MYQRFPLWLFLFGFVALVSLRAQAPAPAAAARPPGQIKAARVVGVVSYTLNGVVTPLAVNATTDVPQLATVVTGRDSSVVLVFSNGATTQLGAETTLAIEEFLQDPFASEINPATIPDEPSISTTRLRLTRGEVVGQVKHLKHQQGSTFTVETPVGAAGIRGTTFRIVFRPTGNGLAFFSLSTVEGTVNFDKPGTGTPGQPATGPTPPAGEKPATGVDVSTGKEVVVTVEVKVDAVSGVVTVTAPPTVQATVPISAETQAAVVKVAQEAAVAAATVTFTTPTTPTTTTPTTTTEKKEEKKEETKTTTTPTPDPPAPPPTPTTPRTTTGDGVI